MTASDPIVAYIMLSDGERLPVFKMPRSAAASPQRLTG
jgi:hypothetical protein